MAFPVRVVLQVHHNSRIIFYMQNKKEGSGFLLSGIDIVVCGLWCEGEIALYILCSWRVVVNHTHDRIGWFPKTGLSAGVRRDLLQFAVSVRYDACHLYCRRVIFFTHFDPATAIFF